MLFLNGEKFISVATGVDAGVGHGLESCTSEIGIIKMWLTGGCSIAFVDTPGFDDNKKSDDEIFNMISDWLKIKYVVPERTEDAADRWTHLGSQRERSCSVASFISIGYRTLAWVRPLSRI